MKFVFVALLALVPFYAQGAVECQVKIVTNGKATESKIDMKKVKGERGDRYEAEKGGYVFQAETDGPSSEHIYKLVVMEKGSNRRSNSRFTGIEVKAPEAFFSTALVLEEGAQAKTAQLNCRLKK